MLRVGLAKLAAQKIAIAKVVGLVGGGVGAITTTGAGFVLYDTFNRTEDFFPTAYAAAKVEIERNPLTLTPSKEIDDGQLILSKAQIQQIIGEKSNILELRKGSVAQCHSCTYAANPKCEDTFMVLPKLHNSPGMLFGVFDGHSGGAAADFCKKELFQCLEYFKNFNIELLSKKSFTVCDQAFLDVAISEKRFSDARSGACMIVSHISDKEVRVANAGDCRCIIGRLEGGKYKAVAMSIDHDITNPLERERLLNEHPNESNIIRRCRVKGRLQPTRGLGDGKYKRMDIFKMFDKHKETEEIWRPPYITSEPDINTHYLDENDKFMILASDGLFQDLNSSQVVSMVSESMHREGQNVSAYLVEKALLAASEAKFGRIGEIRNLSKVINLPTGEKRSVHDDVTALVVFFDKSEKHTSDQLTNDSVHMPVAAPPTLKKYFDANNEALKSKL